jgi:hypothetical protein
MDAVHRLIAVSRSDTVTGSAQTWQPLTALAGASAGAFGLRPVEPEAGFVRLGCLTPHEYHQCHRGSRQ